MKRIVLLAIGLLWGSLVGAQTQPSGNNVNIFSLEQYGTKHDRTTDDAAAFTRAFAACTAAGGGTVMVGPFGYLLNSSIIIPGNCTLQGGANTMPISNNVPAFALTQPYTLLLGSSSVTVQLGSGSTPDHTSALRGVNIYNNTVVPPTSVQTALTAIASFSGTGVTIPHTSGDSIVENVVIAGFTLCLDSETFRGRFNNILGDCTNGGLFNNASDYNYVSNVEWASILTIGVTGSDSQFNITAIANDGAGLAQVTVSSITTNLANGNTVWLTGLGGRTDLTRKWTISNLAVGGSSTSFSLVGSSFGGPTVTGAVTSGSPYVTGLSATSQLGYFGGQTVSDSASGNCIPAATTILWVNPDTNTMQLSANATCSSGTDSIVMTAATYTSGGSVDFNVVYRSGYGFKVSNSQAMYFTNTFDIGHQIEYDISTGSTWASFVQFGCDGSGTTQDPTRICINIEDTASMAYFATGNILDAGIAIKLNTTGGLSGGGFRSIIDGAVQVYNNNYLGLEALSGGILLGSGVNFRSVYPNFIGDSAIVTSSANNAQTASPNTLYQSAADTANINPPALIGALSVTGNAGFGGDAAPSSGLATVTTTDTTPGLRIDSIIPNATSNLQLFPSLIQMTRNSGSNSNLNIKTAAGTYGIGGNIVLSPANVEGFRCSVAAQGGGCKVTGPLQVASSNNITWTLEQTGLPMILPSSGSIANNCAITLTTALPTTYANAYLYFPAGAISSGSAAGLYYTVMSSSTLGTCYNNTYTSGTPAVPASPTAFSTTGPGAYTQVLTLQPMITASLPGNILGVNGEISFELTSSLANDANNKACLLKYGSSTVGSFGVTALNSLGSFFTTRNTGVTNSQMGGGVSNGSGTIGGSLTVARSAVDSTATQNVTINYQLTAATDYMVLEGSAIRISPN